MEHECEQQHFSPLVFTSHTGRVFQVDIDEILPLSPKHGRSNSIVSIVELRASSPSPPGLPLLGGFDGHGSENPQCPKIEPSHHRSRPSCGGSPLISISTPGQLSQEMSNLSIQSSSPRKKQAQNSLCDDFEENEEFDVCRAYMVYNEYGELVDAHSHLQTRNTQDLSVTEILRLIRKAYHHDFRARMNDIEQIKGQSSLSSEKGNLTWEEKLSSWEYNPSASVKTTPVSGDLKTVPVYQGPPRVLEIGCSDGSWCFKVKEDQPDWTVEGVDETDHWSCVQRDIQLKDFIIPAPEMDVSDYFSRVNSSQTQTAPDFNVRNLNCLLAHPDPIPHNLYSFIRGRDVFDRVESYKSFLDDVRLILQPGGVVEFLEVDPRPRSKLAGHTSIRRGDYHQSEAQTDWTDNIADRLKRPNHDGELAKTVPGWMERVIERHKAILRPRGGIPAIKLKSWLEGAGFWDVKEIVHRLPLRERLLPVEIEEIESGNYYLTLHIVTARKPRSPRAGDLLMDGTRQEMTDIKYDQMARGNELKNQAGWKRFELGRISEMMTSFEEHHPGNIPNSSPLSHLREPDKSGATAGF
ncbi:predicted protein [Sclerotinia sclerotiorum 1980 UF-70]|uniref:Methyltransferase domain-containing protein n=2 Tax=Sclerotinia sclerotiorum (strain ATCC 18683 / 1980 / Ss-1) TaxID=665079 RepID=A7E438_SCLS1|nr:predicted protein [Sclerotinia sclerotiorum 1980 UF-70]APA08227.1 hypothetical protein sscle_03g029970 [Sclerotinia sclerotiorum 1980 UF-70]EDN90660.1 predicted protein [Sclerotinia sclerotiorum 1980 UF-70]